MEWLVEREGQRKTAALLGVNRKTVALALHRERLTSRMNLAVQRLMANMDDPGWEKTTPVDRLEARIQVALEVAHELAALVENLTQRVAALEAAQKSADDAVGQESPDAPESGARGLRLFNWGWKRQSRSAEESDG
ncbi:MAG: hypothetical protein F4X20_04505 [Dehalococcoidia bacterium]|nr:hypothetical protein [Dehalococcoidia bacterium]